jgi:TIR domain
MGGVFISYRREDSSGSARGIFDRLARGLGRKNIFFDVDSIAPGIDFVELLTERVSICDALLAVIGAEWISSVDRNNRRRIDNPHDFVRIEIEAALTRGVRVIPVLVDGAAMPAPEDLPESIRKLVRLQGIEISHTRFDADVRRLTRTLRLFENELRQREAAEAERVKLEKREAAEALEGLRRAEADAARRAEDERRAQEAAEAERAAREERERQEAEAARVEEARRLAEAEAARRAEEAREAAEAERPMREERERQEAAKAARLEKVRRLAEAEASRRAEEERRAREAAEAERAARDERERREAAEKAEYDRRLAKPSESDGMGRFQRHGSAQPAPNARRAVEEGESRASEEAVKDLEQAGFAIARVNFEPRDGIVDTGGDRTSVGPALATLKRFETRKLSALGGVAAATAIGVVVLFVGLRTARETIPNVAPVVGTSAIEPEAQILEQRAFDRRLSGERFMDRRRQEIEDWLVEQARLKGQAEHLHDLDEAERTAEAEAASKAASDKAAAQKAQPDKGAANKTQPVKTDTPEGGPATTANAPLAPTAPPKSDQVGANAPPAAPPRPKARPTQMEPPPGGLY